MKFFLSAIVLLAFSFSSCQKEITDQIITSPTGTTSVTGTFKAKINGVQWTANKAAAASFSTAGNGLPRLLNISGLGTDKKFITVTLTDSGVHQYTLSPDNPGFNFGAFQDSSLANVTAFSTVDVSTTGLPNGVVNVTKIDTIKKTISGTFNFIVYRSNDSTKRNITEGVFTDIPYTNGAGLTPASSTDTLRVKVDNVLFPTYSITATKVAFNNTLTVQGSNANATKTVGLTFPDNITSGSYTLDFFGVTYYGVYSNGTTTLSSSSGTLQILEHNTTTKRIRGNFNFRAEALLTPTTFSVLTEGYFSVKY